MEGECRRGCEGRRRSDRQSASVALRTETHRERVRYYEVPRPPQHCSGIESAILICFPRCKNLRLTLNMTTSLLLDSDLNLFKWSSCSMIKHLIHFAGFIILGWIMLPDILQEQERGFRHPTNRDGALHQGPDWGLPQERGWRPVQHQGRGNRLATKLSN